MLFLLTPLLDMSTYTRTPASFAALASSKLKSKSIFRCASNPPARARDVPRLERKTPGVGEIEETSEGQEEDSAETMGRRREWGSACFNGRRLIAEMDENEGWFRRVFKMLEPWDYG